jgi:hypothetical protein
MPTIEKKDTVPTKNTVETTDATQINSINPDIISSYENLGNKLDTPTTSTSIEQSLVETGAINTVPKLKKTIEINQDIINYLNEYSDGFKRIEPIQSGLVTKPEENSIGFWNTLGDMALSSSQGAVNAAENQAKFLDKNVYSFGGFEFGDGDGRLSFQDFVPKYINPQDWIKRIDSGQRNLPDFYEPKTLAGGLTLGMSQFITGFIGPNKLVKATGLPEKSWGIWSLRGSVAGAVTDLTVWDPNQGRLADMLVKFDSPLLNNAVTQYLASNPEDTEWDGRLKNVIEGILVGSGLAGAVKATIGTAKVSAYLGVKAIKKAQGVKDIAQKELIYKETGEAIKQIESGNIDAPIVKIKIAEGNPAINIDNLNKIIKIGKETAKEDTESFIRSILNVGSFKSAEHVRHTIDTVTELFTAEQKSFLKNDVLTNKVALELAYTMARNPEEVLKILPRISADAEISVVRMVASKVILQDLGKAHWDASVKYIKMFGENKKLWTKEAEQEILKYGEVIRDTVFALKEQIRIGARTTQAGNIKVGTSGTKYDVEKFADIIKEYSGDAITIAKKIAQSKPEEVLNIVAKTKMQKSIEVFNSAYVNGLLSGTSTQKIQIQSSIYESLIRPLEQIGGGIARRDYRTIRLGFAQWQGLMHNFKDTWRATLIAFKQADSVIDPRTRSLDALEIKNGKSVKPISGSNLEFDGKVGNSIDWIGKVIEFPSRLLITSDELFKQMNYRGRVYANALDNTMERSLNIYSKEGKANIERIVKESFDADGRANIKNNPLNAQALEYARENAFQNDLKGGSHSDWGGSLQSFLYSHPGFRFIAPFVKTGTNIWRHVENRIPGWGIYTKQMQEMWQSGDRRARAEVIGRQFLGTATTLLAFNYAWSSVENKDGKKLPLLTGGGPANKDIKKVWMNYGWQPYSIASVAKDGTVSYIQYNRMDPRFYVFGIAADVKENMDNINEADAGDAAGAAILSIYTNTLGKAYMRGIADTLDVLSTPTENKLSATFGKVIGGAIPYSAFRSEFENITYETRTFVDSIISKSSLGSIFLEPKRDILTGEPLTKVSAGLHWNPDGIVSVTGVLMGPALVGKSVDVKDDPVLYEIHRLKVPLKQPPIEKEKVDLTTIKQGNQSAYDYWIERIGKTQSSSGRTLKETLEKEFNSYQYKHAEEGGEGTIGGKEYIVSKTYDQFKAYAYQDMINKYPEVKKAIDANIEARMNLLKLNPEETKQKKGLK